MGNGFSCPQMIERSSIARYAHCKMRRRYQPSAVGVGYSLSYHPLPIARHSSPSFAELSTPRPWTLDYGLRPLDSPPVTHSLLTRTERRSILLLKFLK